MGWLLNALANIALEIIADLMTWTVNLVTGLNLDIGMDSTATGTNVPSLGTYIMPTVPKTNLFDKLLPQASAFTTLFMVLAAVIIAFLFSMKLMLAFGGPFVKSEKAGTIYIRTALAVAGTAYSYSIFLFFETLFNGVYQKFMNKYTTMTSGAGSFALDLDNAGAVGTKEDAFNMMSEKLIKGYETGAGLGLSLLVIALFTVLLVSFFRLVLEIYERYVMLGVLFYTSPLAFSTIVSRDMNVFSSWVQMVISEFVVMCSNLFFTGVFISSWTHLLVEGKRNDFLFKTPQEFITTMFIMISWLLIGQQFDQHLKSLGLSTAQTGRGLGGALAAGFGTAATAARMGIRGAEKAAKGGKDLLDGQTSFQRAWRDGTGVPGAIKNHLDNEAQLAKGYSDPDNAKDLMNKINDPDFQGTAAFKDLTSNDLTDAVKAAGGKDMDNYLRENYGAGSDAINPDSTSYEAFQNDDGSYGGRISGSLANGEQFSFDVGSAEDNQYVAAPIGDSFSVPQTMDDAYNSSQQYASRLTAESGSENVRWDMARPEQGSAGSGESFTPAGGSGPSGSSERYAPTGGEGSSDPGKRFTPAEGGGPSGSGKSFNGSSNGNLDPRYLKKFTRDTSGADGKGGAWTQDTGKGATRINPMYEKQLNKPFLDNAARPRTVTAHAGAGGSAQSLINNTSINQTNQNIRTNGRTNNPVTTPRNIIADRNNLGPDSEDDDR